ncbi:Uncharacterised protein [Bordetella pertussis]|nr:Uncharacterised protein [Bordetella pertussis]
MARASAAGSGSERERTSADMGAIVMAPIAGAGRISFVTIVRISVYPCISAIAYA